jgi:hypothetical protein
MIDGTSVDLDLVASSSVYGTLAYSIIANLLFIDAFVCLVTSAARGLPRLAATVE